MPSDRQKQGARGESLAEEWLLRAGYASVARNYSCIYGEIDLIMRMGELLAFIEVKTRRNDLFGSPSESVTLFKQRQITRTALNFLDEREIEDAECRFDVVEVLLLDGGPPKVRHIPGAFLARE